jgi:hypothetical protein
MSLGAIEFRAKFSPGTNVAPWAPSSIEVELERPACGPGGSPLKENEENVLPYAPAAGDDAEPRVDVADVEVDIQRLLDELEIDLSALVEPARE